MSSMPSQTQCALTGRLPRQDSHSLGLDPEYKEVVKNKGKFPKMKTAHEMRDFFNKYMQSMGEQASKYPTPDDPVSENKIEVTSFDGVTISVSRFAQGKHRAALKEGEAPRPAVYYLHGGGMICGSVDTIEPQLKRNVAMWGVQVFAVDYRLAPESPAPGPVEDAFAGLKWLSENAAAMGIDPARIILYGVSAGGGIAVGTALAARDRELNPPLAKQVLVYPMLDDRTKYGEVWPVRQFLGWSEDDNVIGWKAYLGEDKAGKADADVSIYAAPGRAKAEDLVGLPRTYIDVGGLDLFRDEDLRFAGLLLEANVEVEFHLYPGVPHGFEASVTPSVVARAFENRTRAVGAV